MINNPGEIAENEHGHSIPAAVKEKNDVPS